MQDSKRPLDINIRTEELIRFAKRNSFTERETDVFLLLASKVINSTELGKRLGVSHHTVSNHLKNIFQKTKAGNKAELLALFICENLIRQPETERHSGISELPVQVLKASTTEAM